MREVLIGGQPVKLVGAVLTSWVYDDQFGVSMMGDYERMMAPAKGQGNYYDAASKMAWAMARTACYPAPFPDYRSWLEMVGWDHGDEQVLKAVVFEATKALFPGRAALVSALEEQFDATHAAGEPAGAGLPGDGQESGPEPLGTGDPASPGLL